MPNQFIGGEAQVFAAWARAAGESVHIERLQLNKERDFELESIPLLSYYCDDPADPRYKTTVQRSGGCWLASTGEGSGPAGVACRSSIKMAGQRIVEGT